MMPLHQERLDVKVKVMLLFLREALHHLLRSRSLAAVNNVMPGSQSRGTWCSGITPAQHAGGPGFNPQRVQFDLIWQRTLGQDSY